LAILVAVTLTEVSNSTDGARNNPEEEMIPSFADHATPRSLTPVIVAENCSLDPDANFTLLGKIDTVTAVDTEGDNPVLPACAGDPHDNNVPQLPRAMIAIDNRTNGGID
jgi:hypothetical protein